MDCIDKVQGFEEGIFSSITKTIPVMNSTKKCIISYDDKKIENHRVQYRTAKRTIPKEGDVNTQGFLYNFI